MIDPTPPLRIGGLLYADFELLDLFGPLEMFSMLGSDGASITLVADTAGPVPSSMGSSGPLGPKAMADHGFDDAPDYDVLLIPGGLGTVAALSDERLLGFLRDRAQDTPILASVCSGSALLAKAGVLDGHRATSKARTHRRGLRSDASACRRSSPSDAFSSRGGMESPAPPHRRSGGGSLGFSRLAGLSIADHETLIANLQRDATTDTTSPSPTPAATRTAAECST